MPELAHDPDISDGMDRVLPLIYCFSLHIDRDLGMCGFVDRMGMTLASRRSKQQITWRSNDSQGEHPPFGRRKFKVPVDSVMNGESVLELELKVTLKSIKTESYLAIQRGRQEDFMKG